MPNCPAHAGCGELPLLLTSKQATNSQHCPGILAALAHCLPDAATIGQARSCLGCFPSFALLVLDQLHGPAALKFFSEGNQIKKDSISLI